MNSSIPKNQTDIAIYLNDTVTDIGDIWNTENTEYWQLKYWNFHSFRFFQHANFIASISELCYRPSDLAVRPQYFSCGPCLALPYVASFYRESALLSSVIAIVESVRLSVTLWTCCIISIWACDHAVFSFSPDGSKAYENSCFGDVKTLRKFDGHHPQRDSFLQIPSFWNSESSIKRIRSLQASFVLRQLVSQSHSKFAVTHWIQRFSANQMLHNWSLKKTQRNPIFSFQFAHASYDNAIQNRSYTLCSEKKHPLTFSFISPWIICRFKQKLQWIYPRIDRF